MREKWLYCAMYMKNATSVLDRGLFSTHKGPLYLASNPEDIVEFYETCYDYSNYLVRSGVMCLAVKIKDLDKSKLEKINDFVWNLKNPYIYHGVIPKESLFLITDSDGLIGRVVDVKRRKRFWKDS